MIIDIIFFNHFDKKCLRSVLPMYMYFIFMKLLLSWICYNPKKNVLSQTLYLFCCESQKYLGKIVYISKIKKFYLSPKERKKNFVKITKRRIQVKYAVHYCANIKIVTYFVCAALVLKFAFTPLVECSKSLALLPLSKKGLRSF